MTEDQAIERIAEAISKTGLRKGYEALEWRSYIPQATSAWNEIKAIAREDALAELNCPPSLTELAWKDPNRRPTLTTS